MQELLTKKSAFAHIRRPLIPSGSGGQWIQDEPRVADALKTGLPRFMRPDVFICFAEGQGG
jgi:hypothetical protein